MISAIPMWLVGRARLAFGLKFGKNEYMPVHNTLGL